MALPYPQNSAGDLIYTALRKIGVTRSGQTPNPDNMSDGLVALNDMLDSWSTERLAIYDQQINAYALTPGQQNYSIGPGGTFTAPRPRNVTAAGIIIPNGASTGDLRLPLEIIEAEQWVAIPLKAVGSTIPQRLYIDNVYPASGLFLWPYPTVACSLELLTWQIFTNFADLVTPISFPPGYARAIRTNLALELAVQFVAKDISPPQYAMLAELAGDAKAKIKSLNVPDSSMSSDAVLLGSGKGGRFDWRVG